MKRADLQEKTFNRLTVIKYLRTVKRQHAYNAVWQCRCECGNLTEVSTSNLKNGSIKSCGCLQKQRVSEANKTHGLSKTPEYRIWTRIKARCYNRNVVDFPYYGGRGIKMCENWIDSFESFLKDVGKRPSHLHTIDRINNDADYSPQNCKWSTRKTQTRNRGNTKTLTYKGETKPMAEWAEILGLKYTTIQSRVARGWSIDDIIETPKTHKYLHGK